MKEIFKQFATIWRELKSVQKAGAYVVLACLVAALCFVLLKSSGVHLVSLYPGKTLLSSEEDAIETYLEQARIPYKLDPEKGLLVSSEKVEQIRNELTGQLKPVGSKGFELFDTNTWIKGEKELQVLEMRALKGQLEKDIGAFENIKSASVILDIPPQKTFNGSKFQTKASVILTLMPKEHLSPSQLRAIINHLTGAVRGLEPQMIAISDTSGKLYKGIDPQSMDDPLNDGALLFEEHVEQKVSSLLSHIVGDDHFYTNVQAVWNKERDEAVSLSIAAIIDVNSSKGWDIPSFRKEIERQLMAIAKGYGIPAEATVDFIPFDRSEKIEMKEQHKGHLTGWVFTSIFFGGVLVASIPFLLKRRKKPPKEDDGLFKLMTRIDDQKLASSIEGEDPQTIAMMLSYLEPARAEQMIAALHPALQEEVLFHLAELEKGEIP
jgi:flagellar biosynthesis/type III secretory pathway M-ring protein FliF/YscJ